MKYYIESNSGEQILGYLQQKNGTFTKGEISLRLFTGVEAMVPFIPFL